MKYMSKKVHSPELNNHLSFYICCDLSRKIQVRSKFLFLVSFQYKIQQICWKILLSVSIYSLCPVSRIASSGRGIRL